MRESRETDPSYEWFAKADLSPYKGKYVAVVHRRVAASGTNAKKVYAQARRKYPGEEIALAKVPKEDIVFF